MHRAILYILLYIYTKYIYKAASIKHRLATQLSVTHKGYYLNGSRSMPAYRQESNDPHGMAKKAI